MKISAINTNCNFGRIIPIKCTDRGGFKTQLSENGAKKFEAALNGRSSDLYTKAEAKKIRKFAEAIMSDCNQFPLIKLKNTKKYGLMMLSGKDCANVTILEGKNAKKVLKREQKRQLNIDEETTVERYIGKQIENGKFGNQLSGLNVTGKTTSNGLEKATSLNYYFANYFYTKLSHGYVHPEFGETNHSTETNKTKNVRIYDKFLSLDN